MKVLDHLGGLAAGVVLVSSSGSLDLFAARDQFVSWGNAVLGGLRERVTGIGRFDRTERLIAAHSVLVVTSFYEALEEAMRDSGLKLDEVLPGAAEKVTLAIERRVGRDYRESISALVEKRLWMPSNTEPFESVVELLRVYYLTLLHNMRYVLVDMGGLRGEQKESASVALGERTAAAAVRRYTRSYRRLAAEIPEFAVWANMTDAQATRETVRRVGEKIQAGLSDLERQLQAMSPGGRASQRRRDLAPVYQAELGQPILPTAGTSERVSFPALGAAYVNPAFRSAYVVDESDRASAEAWWADRPRRSDLDTFLVSHLTSIAATRTPLVVLGQPGSGKSVLTRVLAGRLPESDFMCVRVELRSVPAETSIVKQIEQAIFQTLHEEVSWPDIARSADGALPVVILDGFDELLQATGMNRADYLEQVQEFQRLEAQLVRPVAVIVTSRIAVADRARFPRGTAVVRLEPFDEPQIEAWLKVWNQTNSNRLAERGLQPLSAATLREHAELATQPLLLLLLALYDSGANALQQSKGDIDRADLYERLFADFVDREISKLGSHLTIQQRSRAVEIEWRRLSAVAVAMLNRGGEVITEAELDTDVPHLLNSDEMMLATPEGAQRALTIGQLLVGRFFFIHESQATRDVGLPERSFEFLHATFGDFLAARLIVEALTELASERNDHHQRHRRGELDSGYFYALTSFATISRRGPLRELCLSMVRSLPTETRKSCTLLIVDLLAEAGYPHPTWSVAAYEPRHRRLAARHAAFSANLVWLAVALADGPVMGTDLFPDRAAATWTEHASLWAGHLDPEDRSRFWQALRVQWSEGGTISGSSFTVSHEDGSPVSAYASLRIPDHEVALPAKRPDFQHDALVPADGAAGLTLREAAVLQVPSGLREWSEILVEYWATVDTNSVYRTADTTGSQEKWVHIPRTLLSLLLRPTKTMSDYERLALLRLTILFGPSDPRYSTVVWQRLQQELPLLDAPAVADMLIASAARLRLVPPTHLAVVAATLSANGVRPDVVRHLVATIDQYSEALPIREMHALIGEECARLGVPSPFDEAE